MTELSAGSVPARSDRRRNARRNAALAVPLVLVNTFAVYGQAGWAVDHVTALVPAAVAFALTVESIGVYLAYEAHASLLAGDSWFRLRAASYAVAALVGAMNYLHYAPAALRPTTTAVTFGALSALSPWLWAIRSRSERRSQLRALGLVDARTAHFSAARWFRFPFRTFRAWSWSVDQGTPDPAASWAGARTSTVQRPPVAGEPPAQEVTTAAAPAAPAEALPEDPAEVVRAADAAGTVITGAELGRMYGKTDRWGRGQIEKARGGRELHAVN